MTLDNGAYARHATGNLFAIKVPVTSTEISMILDETDQQLTPKERNPPPHMSTIPFYGMTFTRSPRLIEGKEKAREITNETL